MVVEKLNYNKKENDLDKAIKELKDHLKYMKNNDLPHEIEARKKFLEVQKLLEDLGNE